MNKPTVACVTCRSLPEPDPDQELLLDGLAAAGARGELAAWDDTSTDWSRFDVCVLRSTWNYYEDRARFLAWAAEVDRVSRLLNPLAVIEANTDKRYLADLETAGVPIVPTVFVEPDAPTPLAQILEARRWHEAVVKPVVGAASYNSRRCRRGGGPEGEAHLRRLLAEGGAMVQPYLRGVEDPGERSIVWIDGEITHAVRKAPRFAGADESVSEVAVPIPAGGAELVRRALAMAQGELLYARVDVVPDDAGQLVVMELELTEPSLFLLQSERALIRFARALAREAAASRD